MQKIKNSVVVCLLLSTLLLFTNASSFAANTTDEKVKAYIATGDTHYNNKDFVSALTSFTKAKALTPNDPGVWEKMAWAACASGNYKEALNYIDTAKNLGMDDTRVSRIKAWTYLAIADANRARGEMGEAAENYQHAINFSSGGIDANVGNKAATGLSHVKAHSKFVEGDECYNNKEWTKSLECFTEAKNLSPKDPVMWEKMAWAVIMTGDCQKGLTYIDKALSLGMDATRVSKVKAWAYLIMADYNLKNGNLTSAKTNYQHAKNFASGGIDAEVAQRAIAGLVNANNGTLTNDDITDATANDDDADDTETADNKDDDKDTNSDDTEITNSETSEADENKEIKVASPSKKEIEGRITEFAKKHDLKTFTDENGRMQAKDSDGKVIQLPPEVFAPSGKIPNKEVIESRIKIWSEKMGLTTGTDQNGRMVAKDAEGNIVPLPASIFYPKKSDENVSSDEANSNNDDIDVASDTSVIEDSDEDAETTSPDSTLLGIE